LEKNAKTDKLFLKKLGARIASIRKEKGISQVELGYLCDIEKSSMNRIESGGTNPTALTLKKIADALELPFEELLKF
jgi:transcriptional regulator with XRE-family HTH domain